MWATVGPDGRLAVIFALRDSASFSGADHRALRSVGNGAGTWHGSCRSIDIQHKRQTSGGCFALTAITALIPLDFSAGRPFGLDCTRCPFDRRIKKPSNIKRVSETSLCGLSVLLIHLR